MATKKIIFFTASRAATVDENAAIAEIEALAVSAYSLSIRTIYDGTDPAYGNDDDGDARNEVADYVAGTIPATGYYHGLPVFNPDAPPVDLPATDAIVSNAEVVSITNSAGADGHNATAAVAANAITSLKLAATVAMVDTADAVVVHNSAGAAVAGAHVAEVAAGVLSDVKLAATIAPIANGAALVVPVTGAYVTTATVTVANGVVTGIVLS